MARLLLLAAVLGSCAAFAPAPRPAIHARSVTLRAAAPIAELEVEDTWWCAPKPTLCQCAEVMACG